MYIQRKSLRKTLDVALNTIITMLLLLLLLFRSSLFWKEGMRHCQLFSVTVLKKKLLFPQRLTKKSSDDKLGKSTLYIHNMLNSKESTFKQ